MNGHRLLAAYLLLAGLASSAGAAPAPPGSVESTALSPTAIRVYWAPLPGEIAGYRVLRDGAPTAELGPDARRFDDSGLEPGRTYRYQVVTLSPAPPAMPPPPPNPA